MSDRIKCKDCKWYEQERALCHRVAPCILPGPADSRAYYSLFPCTASDEYCGMAERREEAEQEFSAVGKIDDELKAKRKDDIRRLTEINKEMLELLENRREHCEYYNLDSGCSACRAKNFCALRMIIDKAKGENNA